jgi:glutaredoxin
MKRVLAALVALNLLVVGGVLWQRSTRQLEMPAPAPSMPASAQVAVAPRTTEHSVVMYGTSWCGYCAQTRRYFADHGIRYTEHDIESSDEDRRAYDALGVQGIPVVIIDGTVLQGYSAENMDSLFAR